MIFDIVHVPDCPNVTVVRDRLRQAVECTGVVATIRTTEVSTPAEATQIGMHGSPTILLDGRDLFPGTAGQPSLSCRLYLVGTAIEGAPSTSQIAAAIDASTSP